MGKNGNVFVTVGTTSFDELIEAMDSIDVIETLKARGYDSLFIQRGRGAYEPKHIISSSHSCSSEISKKFTKKKKKNENEFVISIVDFLPSLDKVLKEASLVISHAGAGSVFEALSMNKPTLVIVNETLMHNHQVELAETLADLGHVAWTKPKDILQALNAFDSSKLVKYAQGTCTLAKDIENFVFNS